MSAILPPSERVWWNQPIDKLEFIWIAIAFVWSLTMFGMMIWWHIYGNQNLANETYKTTKEMFAAKAQAVVDQYTVRTETPARFATVATTKSPSSLIREATALRIRFRVFSGFSRRSGLS